MDKGTGGQAAIEAEANECSVEEEKRAKRRSTVRQNKLPPERW